MQSISNQSRLFTLNEFLAYDDGSDQPMRIRERIYDKLVEDSHLLNLP